MVVDDIYQIFIKFGSDTLEIAKINLTVIFLD